MRLPAGDDPRARVAWYLLMPLAGAYRLDLGSMNSLRSVASSVTDDMMSFYSGTKPGAVPGLLPDPYYWWEAGAMMGSLIDYWYYTGDNKWNDVAEQGLLFQMGPNGDYMPPNQTMTEGNDDQGFWGMAVMTAAEANFPNPPLDRPQWLALAQAVFNTQAGRWDNEYCDGGLRWQIFTWNGGYDYKNSISQACFFNLASRLALYTGNQSYADWADKTWDWMVRLKLIDTANYYVYDGAHIIDCTKIIPYQWTYNAGAFLHGAAAMFNYTTGSARDKWRGRLDGLINGTDVFFTGNRSDIMTEVACESVNLCDVDQQSFKAYLSRWMAAATKWAPWTYDRIKPRLESSAEAAVSTCVGGPNGRMCGHKWTEHGKWDGLMGVGQQMAAMEIVLANMIEYVPAPVTKTGGTSIGDAAAGGSDYGRTSPFSILESMSPVKTIDRAGAWALTVLIAVSICSSAVFMFTSETCERQTMQAKICQRSVMNRGRKRRPTGTDRYQIGTPHFISEASWIKKGVREKEIVMELYEEGRAELDPPLRRHHSAREQSSYWDGELSSRQLQGQSWVSYPGEGRRDSVLRMAIKKQRNQWRDEGMQDQDA